MEILAYKKYFDESWNFAEANTKTLTHCFHSYPAMMIPQVAARLIEKYGKGARLLFDPYCGTGTSLVEATIRNINAIGTDLNPLARIIAKAKTTKIDIDQLDKVIDDFNNRILALNFAAEKELQFISVPNFKNIDFWFTKKVQEKLAWLKNYIDKIENLAIRQFFKVAFSETVRESSLTRNSEFKLYRIPTEKIASFQPDVFGIMQIKLMRNRKGLIEFLNKKRNESFVKVFDFNTVEGIPKALLSEDSVDLVVTSPPYGDSQTTVAYGQFSRLANQWLGFERASQLDKELMGGRRAIEIEKFGISSIDDIIEEINLIDQKRAKEVYSFYRDYFSSIQNIARTIKKGGFVCYVVGNRRVKSITLPTDEITANMFEFQGFEHLETIVRKIPNKKMPSKNSPTNIKGKKETTMNYEYIVVLKKIRNF